MTITKITKLLGFYPQKYENLSIIRDLLPIIKCKLHRVTPNLPKALLKHYQVFETGVTDQCKLISMIIKSCIFKRPL